MDNEKTIVIDFLYLDLSTCERCQTTEKNLLETLEEVRDTLKNAGMSIQLNKINITSAELADQYQFMSSPSIRVNGMDIDMQIKENSCKECGDLCGDQVDCRVFCYEGVEYNYPPKAMILNVIMQECNSKSKLNDTSSGKYVLPKNLANFFNHINKKEN